jgi:hypothetical protein
MSTKSASSRRSFLKSGALLAAPLAAAVPAAVMADDSLQARLARLEDEAAIRQLHLSWLRRMNTGAGEAAAPLFADSERVAPRHSGKAVRGIATDHAGKPDAIEIAGDGRSATGQFPCIVEFETAIAQDCTLGQMAHAQGSGFVRRTERRVLKIEYEKTSGAWSIAKAEFTTV